MKKLFLFISLSWATLSASAQSEILLPQAQQTYIYEEQLTYPTGTEDRCYLIFWQDAQGLHGCLNATTDEFYLAREGYLPGYEIRPLQNIVVKQDSLSFTVEAGGSNFTTLFHYTAERRLQRSDGHPPLDTRRCKTWCDHPIAYKGKIEANRLVIDEGEPFSIPRKRVFIRCNWIQLFTTIQHYAMGTHTSFYGRKLLITYIYDTSTIVLLHLHS